MIFTKPVTLEHALIYIKKLTLSNGREEVNPRIPEIYLGFDHLNIKILDVQSSTCTKILIAFICKSQNLRWRHYRNRRVRVYTTRHPCLVKFNLSSSEQLWMTAVYYQIEDRSSVRDQILIIWTDILKIADLLKAMRFLKGARDMNLSLSCNRTIFSQNIEYHLRIVWLLLNRVFNDEKHFMTLWRVDQFLLVSEC